MTPAPLPVTKATELVGRVNALFGQCPRDMLETKRCEMEAKRLLDLPEFRAIAASILGMLAASRDDLKELNRWHEMSIQLSPTAMNYCNYATSLMNVFEYARALEVAKVAFYISKDKGILDVIIKNADALDLDEAGDYILEWERLYGEQYPEVFFVTKEGISAVLANLDADIAEKKNILTEGEFNIEEMWELVGGREAWAE